MAERTGLLRAFLAVLFVAGAACSASGFSYDPPAGMRASARFAGESGDVLFYVEPTFSAPGGYVERRSSDGEVLWRVSTDGFRPPFHDTAHLTVDDGRLFLRRIGPDPAAFEALPLSEPRGPVALAVSAWLASAGGLYRDGQSSRVLRTSAYNNLSCAIGADSSFAIWDFSDPSSFRTSPAGAIPSRFSSFVDLLCLEADGEMFVALHIIDSERPAGERSRVLIFDAGGRIVHEVDDVDRRGPPHGISSFSSFGDGLATIVGNEEFLTTDVIRIIRRNGIWNTERARVEVPWAMREKIVWIGHGELWIGDSTRNVIRRIPWLYGSAVIEDGQEIVAIADTPLKRRALAAGRVWVSADGRHFLWMAFEPDQFVVEPVGAVSQ